MAVVGLHEIDLEQLDAQLTNNSNAGQRLVTIATVELRVLLRCARDVKERAEATKSEE